MNKYWKLQTNVRKKSQGQNVVQSFENLNWESRTNVGNDEQLFGIMNKCWEERTNIKNDEQILGITNKCWEKVTRSKCS